MTVQTLNSTIELHPGEVATSMMFYTANGLIWGDIVHHESILPTRILTGVTVPEFLTIHNAQIMFAQMNFIGKPMKRREVYLPTGQVLLYHLTPPQKDQLDYDPTEPNRKMAQVNFLTPPFTVQGEMRISEVTTVRSNLEVLKSTFIAFYNLEITHANNPNMKPIRTTMGYVRSRQSIFSLV